MYLKFLMIKNIYIYLFKGEGFQCALSYLLASRLVWSFSFTLLSLKDK